MQPNNICPVTREPAILTMPAERDAIEVDCPTCARFNISRRSFDSMMAEDKAGTRLKALEQAKREAAGSEVPFITGFES